MIHSRKKTFYSLVCLLVFVSIISYYRMRINDKNAQNTTSQKSPGSVNDPRISEDAKNYNSTNLNSSSISGRVLTVKDHDPIQGAFVSVFDSSNKIVNKASTDENGFYEIKPLNAGFWKLSASHERRGTRFKEISIKPRDSKSDVIFYLLYACSVYGYVFDSENQGVQGLDISIADHLTSSWELSTQTDSKGYYEFKNVSPGYQMELSLSDFSDIRKIKILKSLIEDELRGPVNFTLDESATVSGRVFNAGTMNPIENIKVLLRPLDTSLLNEVKTFSDENGFYYFENIPACLAKLEIQDEYYWGDVKKINVYPADSLSDIDFFLKPPAKLLGFLKTFSGQPVSDIEIRMIQNNLETWAISDEEGSFNFKNIIKRRVSISFFNEPDEITTDPSPYRLQFQPGETTSQEFICPSGTLNVKGTVIDFTQHPVKGARIRLIPDKTYGKLNEVCSTFSDSEGQFFCSGNGVDFTHPLKLSIEKPTFQSFIETIILSEVDDNKTLIYEIVLLAGEKISGTVVDNNNLPMEMVQIIAQLENSKSGFRTYVNTDQRGRFTFNNLITGNYTLTAQSSKRALGPDSKKFYHLVNDTKIELVPTGKEDVVIRFVEKGSIKITVIDQESFKPVNEYIARLVSNPNEPKKRKLMSAAVVDPNGEITFPNVDYGEIEIKILQNSTLLKSEVYELTKENTTLELFFVLSSGISIEGYVLEKSTDKPLPDMYIWSDPINGRHADYGTGPVANTDPNGFFTMDGLEMGLYKFQIKSLNSSNPVFYENQFDIMPKMSPIIFHVSTDKQNLFGKVVNEYTQAPVEAVNIFSLETLQHITSDINGNFILRNLPIMIPCLKVTHSDYVTKIIRNIELDHYSKDSPLEIRLSIGKRIFGCISDSSGQLLIGNGLTLRGDGVKRTCVSNKSGEYEFTNLAEGQYAISWQELIDVDSLYIYFTAISLNSEEHEIKLDLNWDFNNRLTGYVLRDEERIPNKNLTLESVAGSIENKRHIIVSTSSDSIGRYEVKNLPTGAYRVFLEGQMITGVHITETQTDLDIIL